MRWVIAAPLSQRNTLLVYLCCQSETKVRIPDSVPALIYVVHEQRLVVPHGSRSYWTNG